MPPRARPQTVPAPVHARPPPAPLPLTTLAGVAQALDCPGAAERLYPTVAGSSIEAQLEAIRSAYRKLAVVVHPDRNPDAATLASNVFARVTLLRQQRETEIEAPALPPRGGFTSRRAGAGSIVRAAHEEIARWAPEGDGYDDTEPPPLPACACVTLARATLPGRVVFCTRAGQEWAVRGSDQKAVVLEHSAECARYRWMNPEASFEHGIVMQGEMFSHHMPGWCWTHGRLVKQLAVDPFARGTR